MSKDYVFFMQLEATIQNLRRDNTLLKEIKNKQEKALEIIKEKPYESAPTINYIKINKGNPKMLNYEHYCMTVKDKVNEEEFEILKEVLECQNTEITKKK